MGKLIAITGGIGSGKSVVSRILRCMDYEVFDSDSRAKYLMDSDDGIKDALCRMIAADVVRDGVIDRRRLAEIVFAEEEKLLVLNSIVHGAVKDDLHRWHMARADQRPVFVETAILYSSGLDKMADAEWRVESPLELRLARTMLRSKMTEDEVLARIEAQKSEIAGEGRQLPLSIILNDEEHPMLPRILKLIREVPC